MSLKNYWIDSEKAINLKKKVKIEGKWQSERKDRIIMADAAKLEEYASSAGTS